MYDFLHEVLSDDGFPVLVQYRDEPFYKNSNGDPVHTKNIPCNSLSHAASKALELEAVSDAVYFATATYKIRRNKRCRTIDNIDRYQSFALDIDVKSDTDLSLEGELKAKGEFTDKHAVKAKTKYNTIGEATAGIKQFIQTVGLPTPKIVSSGGGFHLYWVFDSTYDLLTFRDIARYMIAIAGNLGFKIDRAVVNTPTQILRPVGLWHRKDKKNPKRVTEINKGEHSNVDQFINLLTSYVETNNINVIESRVASSNHKVLDFSFLEGFAAKHNFKFNSEPLREFFQKRKVSEGIFKGCQQIREGGNISEVVAHSCISVLAACEDADEAIEKLAAQNDGESKWVKQLEAKQNYAAQEDKPHSCKRFEEHRPDICEGCQYYNKLKSPIVLGITNDHPDIVEIPPPPPVSKLPEVVESTDGYPSEIISLAPPILGQVEAIVIKSINDCNNFYKIDDQGTMVIETSNDDDGEINRKNTLLTASRIEPIDFLKESDESGNVGYSILWRITTVTSRGELVEEILVGLEELNSPSGLKPFSRGGVIIPKSAHQTKVLEYMRTYAKEVQDAIVARQKVTHLGWQDNGNFVLGEKTITVNNGMLRTIGNDEVNSQSEKVMTTKGELQEWINAANIFKQRGLEHFQLAVVSSFAAPLISLDGVMRGFIYSLHGKSGSGKSTAQEVASAVWGHPVAQIRTQPGTTAGDTLLSMYRFMGANHNLPVIMEELTNMDSDDISSFIYSVSMGSEKDRMGRNVDTGDFKRSKGTTWETLVVSSSNMSLRSKLATAKDNSNAEAMRLFEVMNIPLLSEVNDDEMKYMKDSPILNKVHSNYGHAGEIFIRWVLANRDVIKQMIKDARKEIITKVNAKQNERMWVTFSAVTIVAAIVAKKAGLIDYNIEYLKGFIYREFKNQRSYSAEYNAPMKVTIDDFLNDSISRTIIVEKDASGGYVKRSTNYIQSLAVRVELNERKIYISANALDVWCHRNGSSKTAIVDMMVEENRIESRRPERFTLGKGVKEFKTGRTLCFCIDTTPEELSDLQQRVSDMREEVESKGE